jgi:glycosyltransferase involved in cell wall biosynthesis
MNMMVRDVVGTPGLVTVAIAAYNASHTIVEAVESVLAQSWPALEVVVVDDGSTDGTSAKLADFGDRIRVVTQANSGIPAARNASFAAARGEFIAILDADDVCEPDRIAIQASVLIRLPEVVLCATDFSAFSSEGKISDSFGRTYYSSIPESGLDAYFPKRFTLEAAAGAWPALLAPLSIDVGVGTVYRDLAFGNFVHPPTVMFRRSVLSRSGGEDPALPGSSDWEQFVRMSRCGEFAHVYRSLLRYRISNTQSSSVAVHGGRALVDTVRAADKIWASDPELVHSQRERVRRCTRDFCFDAAYAMAAKDRSLALRMLVRSLANGGVSIAAAKTAARIFLPASLVRTLRGRGGA